MGLGLSLIMMIFKTKQHHLITLFNVGLLAENTSSFEALERKFTVLQAATKLAIRIKQTS